MGPYGPASRRKLIVSPAASPDNDDEAEMPIEAAAGAEVVAVAG